MYNKKNFLILVSILIFLISSCGPTLRTPGPPIMKAKFQNGTFVSNDGAKLPVRSWLPQFKSPHAVIIALHGFNDYSNFFDTPGSYFANEGIISYAYDQRGFGRSPHRGYWAGTRIYTKDLKIFTQLIHNRHPKLPIFILGNSMGGAIALSAFKDGNPSSVKGIILSAPALWNRNSMPIYQHWALDILAHTIPWLTLTGRGLKKIPSNNFEMLRNLSDDKIIIKRTRIDTIYGLTNLMDHAVDSISKFKIRSLILYGQKDEIIPAGPTFKAFLKILKLNNSRQKIALYKDSYHMILRDLQAHKIFNDINSWILNYNKPLTSGADKRALKVILPN